MKITLSNDEVREILAQAIADKIDKGINSNDIYIKTEFDDNATVEVSVEV